MGHSCGSLLHDTLVGHFLWDTLKGHSCETLLRDTVAGHSCGTLLWDTLVGQSCRTHASTLQDERFVLDFLHKSRQVSKTRLPPKVTCQVSKTSASRETSSKTHMSKSANERIVRDFLQNSSGNTHRSTHTLRNPAKQFRESSPSKQHPLTRQSQWDSESPLPQLTTSQFPAPATHFSASTRLTHTKYCACHEM